MINELMFEDGSFGLLENYSKEAVRAEFPPPIHEGRLAQFPAVPEGRTLACLYWDRGREHVAVLDTAQDLQEHQENHPNSHFTWFFWEKEKCFF